MMFMNFIVIEIRERTEKVRERQSVLPGFNSVTPPVKLYRWEFHFHFLHTFLLFMFVFNSVTPPVKLYRSEVSLSLSTHIFTFSHQPLLTPLLNTFLLFTFAFTSVTPTINFIGSMMTFGLGSHQVEWF